MSTVSIPAAKRKLADGGTICGFGITMPSCAMAQTLGASGADFVTLDLEHGCVDLESAQAMIAATAAFPCAALARVPSVRSELIKPILDAGAHGLVFPMVRDREELERGFSAMLYPPEGTRGIGHHYAPLRWGLSPADYLRRANESMIRIALIETAEALGRIDEIAAAPGLDAAIIAPGDLAASLGHVGDPGHAEVRAAIERIETVVKRSGAALGGVCASPEDARRKVERGYRVLVLGFDVGVVQTAAGGLVAAVHG